MISRNLLLALTMVGLGAAVIAVAWTASSDGGPDVVQAARKTPGPGPDAADVTGGPGGASDPAEDLSSASLRFAVPEAEIPLDTGAFAADHLYGRVVDAGGEPIPGATVHAFRARGGDDDTAPALASAETDAGGRFRLADLQEFLGYQVHASAPGYLPAGKRWYCGRDDDLELAAAQEITGLVLGAVTSAPLADVELRLLTGEVVDEDGLRRTPTTTSDAAGRYRFAAVGTEGLLRLRARRPGHQEEQVELQVQAGRRDGYDIHLRHGEVMEVELYDFATEDPLSNATVEVDRAGEYTTDEAGRFSLSLLTLQERQNQTVNIEVRRPGWCTTRKRMDANPSKWPGVLSLPLNRGGTLAGRVTAGGTGVDEARVTYRARSSGRRRSFLGSNRMRLAPSRPTSPGEGITFVDGERSASTAEDGTFALRGLVPLDGTVSVRVVHPEHPLGQKNDLQSPAVGETTEADVELDPGGVVYGTVRINDEPSRADVRWSADGGGGLAHANDHGSYRIEGVPVGRVRLSVALDDDFWGGGDAEAEEVWLEEEGQTVHHDLSVTSAKSTIAGRVRDSGGVPSPHLQVWAWGEDGNGIGSAAQAKTDEEGFFELEVKPLPGAPFVVSVSDGPRRATADHVAAGSTGLELVLPEVGRLGLRVVDRRTGELIPRYLVSWRNAGVGNYESLRDGGSEKAPGPGGIYIAELPLGPVDLIVSAPNLGFAGMEIEHRVVDRSDPPAVVEVKLARGTRVRLRFNSAEGAGQRLPREIQRGRIHLVGESDPERPEEQNENARRSRESKMGRLVQGWGSLVTLTALEPGRYRFEGLGEELLLEPREIDVPPTEEATFEITWRYREQ